METTSSSKLLTVPNPRAATARVTSSHPHLDAASRPVHGRASLCSCRWPRIGCYATAAYWPASGRAPLHDALIRCLCEHRGNQLAGDVTSVIGIVQGQDALVDQDEAEAEADEQLGR